MNRVSIWQYCIIVAGIAAFLSIPFQVEHTAGVVFAMMVLAGSYIFLACMANVRDGTFAIDRRSGTLFRPKESVLRVHGDCIVSSMHWGTEYRLRDDQRVYVIEYDVPDLKRFDLASELIRRGMGLEQYLLDRIDVAVCDLQEWDVAGLRAEISDLCRKMAAKGVTLNVTAEVRHDILAEEIL